MQMATLMEFRGEGNQHKWDGQGRLPGGRRASAGHQRAGRTQVKEEGPSGGEGEGTGFGMEPRGSREPGATAWRREVTVLLTRVGSMETTYLTTQEGRLAS